MAKAKTAKKKPKSPDAGITASPLENPEAIHRLLGMMGPYEPPAPPIATRGYVTWWDCGMSSIRS